MFGDVFHTFSSIPHVAKAVQRVVTRLFNPTTGQSYSSSSEGQADVPEVDAGSKETPRAHVCGECFNCKVRESPDLITPPHMPMHPPKHAHISNAVLLYGLTLTTLKTRTVHGFAGSRGRKHA